MKGKFTKRVIIFIKYLIRCGLVKGVLCYMKLHFFKSSNVVFPGILHRLTLRPHTTDINVFEQIFIDLQYDFNVNYSPRVIIDCGANIGLASVFFANKFPKAKIIAIEPEHSNFEMLKENISHYSNIVALERAVWSENTFLKIGDAGVGHFGFRTSKKHQENDILVEALTIDHIVDAYQISSIDILKIDIEGAEVELFSKNYGNWLSKTKLLAIEIHEWFRKGASKPVIKAVAEYDFSLCSYGEGYVFTRD